MKTKSILSLFSWVAAAGLLSAQEGLPLSEDARPPGFRTLMLPPGAVQKLNLSPEQLKALALLEADMQVWIEQILTPEQLQQLQQMRPPRRAGDRGPDDPTGGPRSDPPAGK